MAIDYMKIRTGIKLVPNAAPGSPENGDIYYDSGSNLFKFYQNGSFITILTSAANTSLSNLSSVAINTSLLPGSDNTINLGSASFRWSNSHVLNSLLYGSTSGAITLSAANTTTSYAVKFPGAQGTGALTNDGSGNLSWTTTVSFSGRAGFNTISTSATSVVVTFSSTLSTTNYGITATLRNTTDSNPQFQPVTITAKSATGFTASWNAPVDSANYALEWVAVPNT